MQLLFYKGRKKDNPQATIFDRAICWIDGGKYSHVEFIVPTSQPITGYYKTWGSHAGRGGVSQGLYLDNSEIDIVEINDNCLGALYNNMGRLFGDYDYLGLPRTKLDWWPKSKNNWFCSSLMGKCFMIQGYQYMGVEDFYQWVMANPKLNATLIKR